MTVVNNLKIIVKSRVHHRLKLQNRSKTVLIKMFKLNFLKKKYFICLIDALANKMVCSTATIRAGIFFAKEAFIVEATFFVKN